MPPKPASMEWKNKPKKRITLETKKKDSAWVGPDGKPSKEMFRVVCEMAHFALMHKGYAGISFRNYGTEMLCMVSAGDYECKEWILNGEEADTLLMSLGSEVSGATK